jgi:HAD superfamily hydrolase (TIGR01459 family)
MKTKFCKGISDINDTYMGFVIDQWGVLHDGARAHDGAVEVLEELQGRGKYVIILSNSGRRADENVARMEKMGLGPDLYNRIITSGEMVWRGLSLHNMEPFVGLGPRCYVVSRDPEHAFVRGLETVEVVEDVGEADFLLFVTTDSPNKTLKDYEPMLRAAVRRGLPALCANPDSRALYGAMHVMGVGTLARRYQDFGGIVHYIGKPHRPIYNKCFKHLVKRDIYPAQTVMIGDSMTHDILGGHMSGIDTCLVKSGMHAGHFKDAHTPAETDRALDRLCASYNNIHPKYLVDRFAWGEALPDRKNKRRKPTKAQLRAQASAAGG